MTDDYVRCLHPRVFREYCCENLDRLIFLNCTTLLDLSEHSNVNIRTLRRFSNRESLPDIWSLQNLCCALGCNISELIGDDFFVSDIGSDEPPYTKGWCEHRPMKYDYYDTSGTLTRADWQQLVTARIRGVCSSIDIHPSTIAKIVGARRDLYAKYLTGYRIPSAANLMNICTAARVSPNDVIAWSDGFIRRDGQHTTRLAWKLKHEKY